MLGGQCFPSVLLAWGRGGVVGRGGAGQRGGATSLQECLSWNQSGREPSGSAGRVVGPGGTLVSVGGQVGECRRHKASFSFCCFLLFTVYIGFKRLCASRFKRPYTLYEHAHIPPPPPPRKSLFFPDP